MWYPLVTGCRACNVWGRIIEAWLGARLIGKTATPERLDGKGLDVEAGGYFELRQRMGEYDLEQAARAAGIRAASVSGGPPAEERKCLIPGLGTGEGRCSPAA